MRATNANALTWIAALLSLVWLGCSPLLVGTDGGTTDAGQPRDAAAPDSSGSAMPDASGSGAGASDAGSLRTPDAGSVVAPDAGFADAGGTSDSGFAQRFPATSIIYQDISNAALDPSSTAIINHLSASGGWGSGNFQIDFGLAVLYADDSVPLRSFTPASGYYSPDCDLTRVPVPPGGSAEGSTDYACDTSANDCHILIYQGTRLFELYQASIAGGQYDGNSFTALCEVMWDLTHDYWQSGASPYSRGDQCTSADAAGMPIAPLLVTGAELQAGLIQHAMRFTLPNSEISAGVYLHPGTHAGGPSGDSLMPAYTARFRLKSSFDVSSLSAGAQTIARALQTYGMFLDDGGNIPLTIDQSAAAFVGSHDLGTLQVTDFEIVAAPDAPVALTDNCQRTPLTAP
jgi:hypothetical protein